MPASSPEEAHLQDKAHMEVQVSVGWVSVRRAKELLPSFKHGWKFSRLNRSFRSPFGFTEHRVQLDAQGKPAFDRVVYGEAPNINAVVWGVRNGLIYIGVTVQARPFADMPDGSPADPPIVFAQPCVMGFNLERVAGKDAALREASEEAGTESAVLSIRPMGYHSPNPTFCATWSELYSIQVDLDKIEEGKTDHSELIYRVEFEPLPMLLGGIGLGYSQGVNYRSATANDAFLVWLVYETNFYPELLDPMERDSLRLDQSRVR